VRSLRYLQSQGAEDVVSVSPTCLCIISGRSLRSADFIMALQESLSPGDHVDIIIDRRGGESSWAPDSKEDRRHRQVDRALAADGFVIVPTSADPTTDSAADRSPLVRIEHLSLADHEDLESIESSPGVQQSGRPILALLGVAIGVTVAALLLSLVMYQTNESSNLEQLRGVTEKPAIAQTWLARSETPPPARPNGVSPPDDGPARTKLVSPGATPKEPSRRPRVASIPASENVAPASGGTDEIAGGHGPRLSATVRPSPGNPASSDRVASALPPEAATPQAAPTQSVGARRAELVRKPISRGWGDSYTVRLLSAQGRPVVVSSVRLIAHMADGTVESIAMGALSEPGTYRGTVPTGRSTPVDLLVRLSIGDKSVEVPVKR
jgi:hypothetical protein